MIIGVVVCVVLFAVAYQTLIDNPVVGGTQPPRAPTEPIITERAERSQVLGVVNAIETFAPRHISVMNIESGRTERFNITDTTTVQNRAGSPIGFGEVNLGQIIEVVFDDESRDAFSLALSSRAWEQQHRGNFVIDLAEATITIGNRVYPYSSRTLILNRDEPFSIGLINQEDVITIVGYQDKIWSVRVDSGHGFIRFENADQVMGGRVAIGNNILTALDGTRPIAVIEDTHRLIIEGLNIETFIADVIVRQGETVVVDLLEVTFRTGTLQIVVEAPDASFFINGELVELENSLVDIEYGTHILRVEAPGFIPIQEEFEFSQPFMRIAPEMERDAPTEAQLLIETFPSDAQIFLDGVYVGNSPLTITVDFGQYTFIARKAGYLDRPLPIIVDEHSSRQFLLHLTQMPMQPPANAPVPPGQLPPLPPDWQPVPSPTIPPEWNVQQSHPTPPPVPIPTPTQAPAQQWPPPPGSVWPPTDDELPIPDLPMAPGYLDNE